MKSHLLLLLTLSGFACSTAHVGMPGASAEHYVFPYGKYEHRVQLTIHSDGAKDQEFRMNGVVRIDEKLIQVVALSAFGTTMFKITDHKDTGKIDDEIYVQQLKSREEKLLAYYQELRQLLVLKRSSEIKPNYATTLSDGSKLTLGEFDENQIPKHMEIKSPHFNVQIEVTRYAL